MTMFRPRSRVGRLAFATIALLAGCSTARPPSSDAVRLSSVQASSAWTLAQPDRSVVLLRVIPQEGTTPADGMVAAASFWDFQRAVTIDRHAWALPWADRPLSDGWIALAAEPGPWFVRLRPMPGGASSAYTFSVPTGQAALYLGTFRRVCEPGAGPAAKGRACSLVPAEQDDAAEAGMVVPPGYRQQFPVRVASTRPYPPALRDLGLPAPATYAVQVDPAAWLTAVDWDATEPDGAQAPAARDTSYTSGIVLRDDAGGDLMVGLVVGIALLPVALVGLALLAERNRQARITAEERRARAEQLRAMWSPCEVAVTAALAPDRVQAHLQQAAAAPAVAGVASRAGAARPDQPWQASVTRVVLRRCGAAPDHFGVEVATRWTAQRRGEPEPAFDARYSRWVEGAHPDGRLRFSQRPAWEVPVTPEGACRPLAAWCGDGGATLLDEVLRGVTGARDAIAATR